LKQIKDPPDSTKGNNPRNSLYRMIKLTFLVFIVLLAILSFAFPAVADGNGSSPSGPDILNIAGQLKELKVEYMECNRRFFRSSCYTGVIQRHNFIYSLETAQQEKDRAEREVTKAQQEKDRAEREVTKFQWAKDSEKLIQLPGYALDPTSAVSMSIMLISATLLLAGSLILCCSEASEVPLKIISVFSGSIGCLLTAVSGLYPTFASMSMVGLPLMILLSNLMCLHFVNAQRPIAAQPDAVWCFRYILCSAFTMRITVICFVGYTSFLTAAYDMLVLVVFFSVQGCASRDCIETVCLQYVFGIMASPFIFIYHCLRRVGGWFL
jgi:hypothetical protein